MNNEDYGYDYDYLFKSMFDFDDGLRARRRTFFRARTKSRTLNAEFGVDPRNVNEY